MGNQIKDLKGTVWIIDPIDGTLNFIHQQRNFAISLGDIRGWYRENRHGL